MQPIPIPQSVSWNASLSVVPKSAKKWARTAHIHEVKSAKNAKKVGKMRGREKADVPIGLEWDLHTSPTSLRKKERDQLTDLKGRSEEQEALVVDRSDDDVFAAPSLSQCLSSTLTLHDGCADARMVSETVANGSSPESARDIHGVNGTSLIAREMMTLRDESDPWVDTDSATSGGDDDHEDTYRVSYSTSRSLSRQ